MTVITGQATAYRTQQETDGHRDRAADADPVLRVGASRKGRDGGLAGARSPTRRGRPPNRPWPRRRRRRAPRAARRSQGLNEQYEPTDSNDHTAIYFHWWPKKNSTEWVQYDFAAPGDDLRDLGLLVRRHGPGRVPDSARLARALQARRGVGAGGDDRRLRHGEGPLQHGALRAGPDDGGPARGAAAGEVLGRHPGVESQIGTGARPA